MQNKTLLLYATDPVQPLKVPSSEPIRRDLSTEPEISPVYHQMWPRKQMNINSFKKKKTTKSVSYEKAASLLMKQQQIKSFN